MKKAEKDKLEKALNSYLENIHKIYVTGDFREESFYPSVKGLIERCSQCSREGSQERRIKSSILWWTFPLENKRSLVCGCQGLP